MKSEASSEYKSQRVRLNGSRIVSRAAFIYILKQFQTIDKSHRDVNINWLEKQGLIRLFNICAQLCISGGFVARQWNR